MQSTDRQRSGMADRRIPETFMWIAMQSDFPWTFASVDCLLYFLYRKWYNEPYVSRRLWKIAYYPLRPAKVR